VLAQNVANADTPGYAARDIKRPDFERMLRQLQRRPGVGAAPVVIAKTDSQHLSGGGGGTAFGGEVKLDPTKTDGLEPSPFTTYTATPSWCSAIQVRALCLISIIRVASTFRPMFT
jgi:hypothetical protein